MSKMYQIRYDDFDIEKYRVQHGTPKRPPIRRTRKVTVLTLCGTHDGKHRPSLRLNESVWMAILQAAEKRHLIWRSEVASSSDAKLFAETLLPVLNEHPFTEDQEAANDLRAVIEFLGRGRGVVVSTELI